MSLSCERNISPDDISSADRRLAYFPRAEILGANVQAFVLSFASYVTDAERRWINFSDLATTSGESFVRRWDRSFIAGWKEGGCAAAFNLAVFISWYRRWRSWKVWLLNRLVSLDDR
jgi:hypothetical protein